MSASGTDRTGRSRDPHAARRIVVGLGIAALGAALPGPLACVAALGGLVAGTGLGSLLRAWRDDVEDRRKEGRP